MGGRHVLVVEDEFLPAEGLARTLRQLGARVIGPVSSVREALKLIQHYPQLDGAVLDVYLRVETSLPIADMLAAREIPFIFVTPYGVPALAAMYAGITCLMRPVHPGDLVSAMARA